MTAPVVADGAGPFSHFSTLRYLLRCRCTLQRCIAARAGLCTHSHTHSHHIRLGQREVHSESRCDEAASAGLMIGDGILFGTKGRANERAGMGKLSGHAVGAGVMTASVSTIHDAVHVLCSSPGSPMLLPVPGKQETQRDAIKPRHMVDLPNHVLASSVHASRRAHRC